MLAWVFFCTTLGLGGALAWTWIFATKLALKPLPDPPLPAKMQVGSGPASPLQQTPPNEILTVDIGASRALGVYPMPVSGAIKQDVTAAQLWTR